MNSAIFEMSLYDDIEMVQVLDSSPAVVACYDYCSDCCSDCYVIQWNIHIYMSIQMLSYIISLTFSVLHHFLYLQVIIQPLTVRYIISEMYFSVLQLSLLLQYDVIIYSRYIGNMESVNNTFNISLFCTYNHYDIVEVHYDSQHRGNLLSSNMTPNVCKQIHTLSHIHTHMHNFL